jgi:hypothetical protein
MMRSVVVSMSNSSQCPACFRISRMHSPTTTNPFGPYSFRTGPFPVPPQLPGLNGHVRRCADMLGVFAEFETNLRKERQLEGIADAKARGVYRGRKPSIDPGKVKALKAEGMGPSAIAKTLKIGRASVYRALED